MEPEDLKAGWYYGTTKDIPGNEGAPSVSTEVIALVQGQAPFLRIAKAVSVIDGRDINSLYCTMEHIDFDKALDF